MAKAYLGHQCSIHVHARFINNNQTICISMFVEEGLMDTQHIPRKLGPGQNYHARETLQLSHST